MSSEHIHGIEKNTWRTQLCNRTVRGGVIYYGYLKKIAKLNSTNQLLECRLGSSSLFLGATVIVRLLGFPNLSTKPRQEAENIERGIRE